MQNKKPVIFISHATPDGDTAQRLKHRMERLTSGSLKFFLSCDRKSLPPGEFWFDHVRKALDETEIMLVLASSYSTRSSWVLFEAGYAAGRGKPIIPLLLPGYSLSDLRPPLQFKQVIAINSFNALNTLVDYLNQSFETKFPKAFRITDMAAIFGKVEAGASSMQAIEAVHLETREAIYSEIIRLIKLSARNAHIRATSTLDDRRAGTDKPFDNYIAAVAERCGEAKKRGDADRYTLVMSFTPDKEGFPPVDRQRSIKRRRSAFARNRASDRILVLQHPEHWSLDTLTIGEDNLIIGFPSHSEDLSLRYGLRITSRDFVSYVTDWFDSCVRAKSNPIDPVTLKVQLQRPPAVAFKMRKAPLGKRKGR